MRAEKVVKTLLAADATIASYVGTRIWGGMAQQDVDGPFIVYRKLAASRDEGIDPADVQPGAATCVVSALMEVVVVARDYEQMKSLGEAVRLALAYKRGTVAGVELLGISIEAEGADEYSVENDEHFQPWTFRVQHSEP
jgi:hypothetical protein